MSTNGKRANGKRPATRATRSRARSKKEPASDPAVSYDEFKDFEGRKYTGMKIGRSHKWYYDQGEWKEKKITPDLWQISYAVTKRRAGKAPEGSGVPVGTEYHWYVLAHQNVTKISANDYTTTMAGLKYKIAHKRADTGKWSATPKTQRKRMIKFLQGVIADLESEPETGPAAAKEPKAVTKTRRARKSAEPALNENEEPEQAAVAGKAKGTPGVPPSMAKPTRRRRKAKASR